MDTNATTEQFWIELLYALATKLNKRVAGWYGRRGGSKQRRYICYLCRACIDTESARDRPTVHAQKAIAEHRKIHVAEIAVKNTHEKLAAAEAAWRLGMPVEQVLEDMLETGT
jgi:hypothetical protein